MALTACTTLAISRAAILDCLANMPHLWEGLARDLVWRVAEDEERIMRLARDPVDVRLAWLLVYLVRLGDAVEEDGSLRLPIELSAEELALWIGAKRRSVVAALQDSRLRGVVARRDGKLAIWNLGFLIKMADIPSDRRTATQPKTPALRLVSTRPEPAQRRRRASGA